MPNYNPWLGQNGQIRIGININPRQIENFYTGTIETLVCDSIVNYGTLTEETPAVNASFTINYTGGNAGTHPAITISSIGVTGLVATLEAGSYGSIDGSNIDFNDPTNNGWGGQNQITGDGTLTFNITGTPNTAGIATFLINVDGKTCVLNRNVGDLEPGAIKLNSLLGVGSIINGRAYSDTGYYKVKYWDGTTQIKSNTFFSKTSSTPNNGSSKQVRMWPCDINGNVTGSIYSLFLDNAAYIGFDLDNMQNLKYLTIRNNNYINTTNLDFSKLTSIESITLENLPMVTGVLDFTSVSSFDVPSVDLQSTQGKYISLKGIPVTTINVNNLDGLRSLTSDNMVNLTTVNNNNCSILRSIVFRNCPLLNSFNSQLSSLKNIELTNCQSYTSEIIPPIALENLILSSAGISTINLSNLTSLKTLELSNINIDNVAVTSLYDNTLLRNVLEELTFINITCPYIDLSLFQKLFNVKLTNLPNITSFNLPTATLKYIILSNMPGITPSEMDNFIISVDANGISNGWLRLTPYSSNDMRRTSLSDTQTNNLKLKSWNLGYWFDQNGQGVTLLNWKV